MPVASPAFSPSPHPPPHHPSQSYSPGPGDAASTVLASLYYDIAQTLVLPGPASLRHDPPPEPPQPPSHPQPQPQRQGEMEEEGGVRGGVERVPGPEPVEVKGGVGVGMRGGMEQRMPGPEPMSGRSSSLSVHIEELAASRIQAVVRGHRTRRSTSTLLQDLAQQAQDTPPSLAQQPSPGIKPMVRPPPAIVIPPPKAAIIRRVPAPAQPPPPSPDLSHDRSPVAFLECDHRPGSNSNSNSNSNSSEGPGLMTLGEAFGAVGGGGPMGAAERDKRRHDEAARSIQRAFRTKATAARLQKPG
jgi:hypothetical protein